MILNMAGGGGGADKSQIIVTAPTGSTVTCAMGDVVKTAAEKDGTWHFKGLELGMWTVNAVHGEKSASKDVTLERLSIEYITINFDLKLIVDGTIQDIPLALSNASQKDGYVMLSLGKNGNASIMVEDMVELDTFDSISVDYTNLAGGSGGNNCYIKVRILEENMTTVVAGTTDTNVSSGTLTLDVSALTGQYYVQIYARNSSGSATGSGRIQRFVVEA